MDRKHLIIPAALLAGSALLAGRAVMGALPLGPDAQPAASVGSLADATDGTDVASRTALLDAAERRINALDAQVPPALPAVPAPAPVASQVRVASPSSSASATTARGGDDDRGGERDRDDDDDRSGHGGGGDDGGSDDD